MSLYKISIYFSIENGIILLSSLSGADSGKEAPHNYEVIQGQLCDVCDPTIPNQAHSPNQALDGTERWWQSPPLSRGLDYNQVNLTIDLAQVNHFLFELFFSGSFK